MYFIVTLIFIPLGVVIFVKSARMVSTPRLRYDNFRGCDIGGQNDTTGIPGTCTIPITVDRDVEAPSFLYYGMVNFYQNARRYVESRSDEQLRGRENPDVSECDPLITDENGQPLVPCGLIAQSSGFVPRSALLNNSVQFDADNDSETENETRYTGQFNDEFRVCTDVSCSSELPLTKDGIAWDIDRTKRFTGNDEKYTKEQNDLIRDQDFMVWMRSAAYRNWKKLYRIINVDIPKGNYYVQIKSSFPVEDFGGEKFFFLSETTWFGGPNRILGLAYIVVGGVALSLGIMFAIRAKMSVELDLPPETRISLTGFVADSSLLRDEDRRDIAV